MTHLSETTASKASVAFPRGQLDNNPQTALNGIVNLTEKIQIKHGNSSIVSLAQLYAAILTPAISRQSSKR
jgi:hypothetical protein